jgi:upstream activation factor subunit UAF30
LLSPFGPTSRNKYVGAHIHPYTPVNLEELSENSKRRKEELARKRKAKEDAKKEGKKRKMKKRKEGSHPPYRLSPELQAVVGKEILPRPQVTQALWIYIKANNLQSDTDKRVIVCDDLMKPIMGGNDTGKSNLIFLIPDPTVHSIFVIT